MGIWEAKQAFGEELEMHHIELDHDVLGCRDCSIEGSRIYCSQSRYHPNHPLHICPWVGVCGCLTQE